jgi:hypothetical protein
MKSASFPTYEDGSLSVLFSLIFLVFLTLFGLAKPLCDLAKISVGNDGSIPRGRFLIIIIGFCNMVSGGLEGPPIVISPESAGGIKAGGKTGMCAVVCGLLFLLALFLEPLLAAIPAAGTSPILIAIGYLLFMNVKRIDFADARYGLPAFCCLFYIPFTNNLICGVLLGIVVYLFITGFTLDLVKNYEGLMLYYFSPDTLAEPVNPPPASTLEVESGSVPAGPKGGVRNRRASFVPTATSARRASMMFVQNVTSEVDVEVTVSGTMLSL